ncbi:branched chain amino acid ABC transporter substrate-binding protein [Streptomyces pluripotens]|uniref:Branched chain amino acid ABC transporter substrate-binding protein n=1 Tax=Streptomyces pluripotens TaxID=1355015 RepID=A0A221P7P8_9ACTN|nr:MULTISPECIES: branched-chain amino acid ABC transporter substrate-binding protein [Streptomyces]ARP74008.1 branched chain amino acid ABC transporter substrate-binding protein [Streptomyces pluripotens]ASN28271.1 branched chain amino acid ABC transporter substrate-binding protein [Streptomyces pluripotens]KIE24216.1 branched-chain amino acid ABC transporter substrate-binding protein [Streptomyces sp. MUSC 125]MCH0555840.1 branched-chain amino acid ABC transporter substrate-binding protein [St
MVILTSVLTTGALTLTACGSRNNDSKGGDSGNVTVTIGVDAPLTGQNSATGLGIQYGAQIAVDDANKNKTVPGVTFKIKALDDKAIPATGQQNATQLVSDSNVLGVVGPLNSGVATQMQQTFATANLVEISPSNTAPELTQGKNWQTAKQRPFKTYFRTATTDALQGAFAADYAYNGLKKKKAFVVDDKQTYGAGLSKIFRQQFVKQGGKVIGTDHVNVGDRDFSTLVTKIKNSGADILYYGGQYDESEVLTKQLKEAGAKIPLFGGDGMFTPTYIKTAGKTAEGDLVTSIGVPVDTLPAAKDFVATYKAKKYPGDYGTYGSYAYDATTAIIKAVGQVVKNGKVPSDARAKVVDAVQNTSFDGISGKISFDQYGDTTNKQLTVYQVIDGKWKSVKSGTANPK